MRLASRGAGDMGSLMLTAGLLPLLLVEPSTAGQPIDLEWVAPAGCPSAAEVLARVELGPQPHPVVATAQVSEGENEWSLVLRVEGYGGADTRALQGESCEALADAAALLIQVATGPESEAETPSKPVSVSQERQDDDDTTDDASTDDGGTEEPRVITHPPDRRLGAGTGRPDPAPAPAPDPRDTERLPLVVHARAAGLVQFGAMLPGIVAGGAGLAAGISIPWFRIEARGTYLAPRQLEDADNPGVGIRVDGWGLGGSACGLWEGERLFVPACLGAQAGRTRARAYGLEQPGVGRGLWAQAIADVGLGIRLHPRVALTAAAEVAVSLRRPRFHVRGFPTLFQTGTAASRAVVGLEVLLRRPKVRGPRG